MAREESNREDLLREATALVERIELAVHGDAAGALVQGCGVVAGFRRNGSVSFFFGGDPVYQFNAAGELRRAYCNGQLLKAQQRRLATMHRARQANEVQLVSRPLTDDEQATFLAAMHTRLQQLAKAIEDQSFELVGQVPADIDILSRVRGWLSVHTEGAVAVSPGAGA